MASYLTLYTDVAQIRFNSADANELARVKRWVNAAELEVWNAADWVFKRQAATNLAVVSGNRQPAMPADFGKVTRLYDQNGCALTYLPPDEWEALFLGDTSSGTPAFYTVVNRQIFLGPTPSASVTFKVAYRRRYAHLNNVAATVAGVMSADTDTPIWDSEHHYVLVPMAIYLGAKLEKDTSPQDYKDAADGLLAAMIAELVPDESGEILKWGSHC